MKWLQILFIIFFQQIVCLEASMYLPYYLKQKIDNIKDSVVRQRRAESRVKLKTLCSANFTQSGNRGHIFTLFDNLYATVDNEVYKVSVCENQWSKIFTSKHKLVAVEATEYKNSSFVVFATENGILHIYQMQKENAKFYWMHDIINSSVNNLKLFIQNEELYLEVITNNQLKIYKFVETYFSMIDSASTESSYSYSFSSSKSLIILVGDLKFIKIYKFNNNNLQRVHKFGADQCKEVLTYVCENKTFLVLFYGKQLARRYLWTGEELIFQEEFRTSIRLNGEKRVIYHKSFPYLMTINNDIVNVFSLRKIPFEKIDVLQPTIFKNLLDAKIVSNPNNSTSLLSIGKTSKYFYATSTSVLIQDPFAEVPEEKKSTLNECFFTLEKNIYTLRRKLKKISELTSKRFTRQVNHWQKLDDLKQKINSALFIRNFQRSNDSTFIVNTTTTLTKFIQSPKITIHNLNLNTLNGKKWDPNRWLSYTKNQTINGSLTTKNLELENLQTSPQDLMFTDFLFKTGDQHITGKVTVQNLKTTNLITDTINNIPFENIYLKSHPVIIKGSKKLQNFKIHNISTHRTNEVNSFDTLNTLENKKLPKYILTPNLIIDNLWVENINGVNIDKFMKSVFRLGSSDVLQGNLIFSNISTGNIRFKTFLGHEDYLTGFGNQTIESSIKIKKIITNTIEAEKINGIDFKRSVATFGSIIKSPTNIDQIIIQNLQIENETQTEGTNSSDFIQRYNGRVKITGNVYIKNLIINAQAKLLLSGEEFDTSLTNYWTRNTEQKIDTQFEAANGITTPHLFANFLNGVNVSDFMINTNKTQKAAKFYFENVKVKGNVILNTNYQHLPNIKKIQNTSLLKHGNFHIKNKKTFKTVLVVDNLNVRELRDKQGNNYLDAQIANVLIDPKLAKSLLIRGNMICKLLKVEKINKIDLNNLLESTLYIDQLNQTPEINFRNVEVKNLTVTVYNGELMNDVIMKVEQQKNISEIDNVIVNQDAEIAEIQNLKQINDKSIDQIDFGSIESISTPRITENTRFLKNVEIDNLLVKVINNVDFKKLSKRVLYKRWKQTILKHATFGQIKTNNFFATKINDKVVENLIDISSDIPQKVFLNTLSFNRNIEVENLHVNCSCDIKEAFMNMKNPPSQIWRNVIILGNATFWDQEASVVKILRNVVTSQGYNEITGKVTFQNHISAQNMFAQKTINGIILNKLFEDAFLNNQNKAQVIKGKKTFQQLTAKHLIARNFLNVSKINDIDIVKLKNNILFKNSDSYASIKGKKTFFGGLQTKNFQTAAIGNVKAENLVSFNDIRPIPDAVFEYVTVINNLNIETVNKMPFDDFLSNRILKNAKKQKLTGRYFFKNLKILGNSTMERINNISMNRIIFDNDVQIIESYKAFKNDLTIVGNITVDTINGLNLSNIYRRALTLDKPNIFNKTLHLYGPIDLNGCISIEASKINNIPADYILEVNMKQTINLEVDILVKIKQKLTDFIYSHLDVTKGIPNEIMYIEKTNNLQFSFPNISKARIVETQNAVLFHIENVRDGRICGLPESCNCPTQQTVQISAEHSINMFLNKGVQRIYSYYEDRIIINIITNSISTGSYCRTSNTRLPEEVTSLTWNIYPTKDKPGGFFIHPRLFKGYISNVEFFTIAGKTYIVIGVVYDPLLNTHDVDCIVLGFNENKNKFEEVDKISSEGMKVLSLFYTSRGVILIMSRSTLGLNGKQTKILRFNCSTEKFDVLRILPRIGSSYAIGVVLHKDSFIILESEKRNLHIFKYQQEYDNYHFFQTFWFQNSILSLSVFYTGDFGISDAYFSVVMTNDRFGIFSFDFLDGWKLKSWTNLDGIKSLVPFSLNKKVYFFVPATKSSSILNLVQHDSN